MTGQYVHMCVFDDLLFQSRLQPYIYTHLHSRHLKLACKSYRTSGYNKTTDDDFFTDYIYIYIVHNVHIHTAYIHTLDT